MTEHIKMERYTQSLKGVFSTAQTAADRRKHVHVTVHHVLVALLEAGYGAGPLKRAGIDPATLLAKAAAAVDALPASATSLAFLGPEVLATMAEAEATRMRLAAPLIDIQCMYIAFTTRKHLPPEVGATTWSDGERVGNLDSTHSEKPMPLSAALREASAGFVTLADDIAALCGMPREPKEVRETLEHIRSLIEEHWPPFLRRGWHGPTLDGLVFTRDGGNDHSVMVGWDLRDGIALTISQAGQPSTRRFHLAPSKRWMSGDIELFGALRAAILGLYAEMGATAPSLPAQSVPLPSHGPAPTIEPFGADEPSDRLQKFMQELWEALVPPSGACASVQGELVRANGRLREELNRNGMGNYYPSEATEQLGDTMYSNLLVFMLDTLIANRSNALAAEEVAYLAAARRTIDTDWKQAQRIAELAGEDSPSDAQDMELRTLEEAPPQVRWDELFERTGRCIGNWCIANPILFDKSGSPVVSKGRTDIRSMLAPPPAPAPCNVCGGKGWRPAKSASDYPELCICKGGKAHAQ